MKRLVTLIAAVLVAAPMLARAEESAPQLSFLDAAAVRAQLDNKEMINPVNAFPGMQVCTFTGAKADTCVFTCKNGATITRPRLNSSIDQNGGCAKFVMVQASYQNKAAKDMLGGNLTKVENPKYVCQNDGGGYAVAVKGGIGRVWQVDGASSGVKEGLELGGVAVTPGARPGQLGVTGKLEFFGTSMVIKLEITPDAADARKAALNASMNNEPTLTNVPCTVLY